MRCRCCEGWKTLWCRSSPRVRGQKHFPCLLSQEQARELLWVKTNAAEASVSHSCEFFALQFVAGYVTAAVGGGGGWFPPQPSPGLVLLLGGWWGSGSACPLCHLTELHQAGCVASMLPAQVMQRFGVSVTPRSPPRGHQRPF